LRLDAEAALQVSALHRSDAENMTRNRQRADAADDPFRQDKPMDAPRRDLWIRHRRPGERRDP
jgi:hypothetical protein